MNQEERLDVLVAAAERACAKYWDFELTMRPEIIALEEALALVKAPEDGWVCEVTGTVFRKETK